MAGLRPLLALSPVKDHPGHFSFAAASYTIDGPEPDEGSVTLSRVFLRDLALPRRDLECLTGFSPEQFEAGYEIEEPVTDPHAYLPEKSFLLLALGGKPWMGLKSEAVSAGLSAQDVRHGGCACSCRFMLIANPGPVAPDELYLSSLRFRFGWCRPKIPTPFLRLTGDQSAARLVKMRGVYQEVPGTTLADHVLTIEWRPPSGNPVVSNAEFHHAWPAPEQVALPLTEKSRRILLLGLEKNRQRTQPLLEWELVAGHARGGGSAHSDAYRGGFCKVTIRRELPSGLDTIHPAAAALIAAFEAAYDELDALVPELFQLSVTDYGARFAFVGRYGRQKIADLPRSDATALPGGVAQATVGGAPFTTESFATVAFRRSLNQIAAATHRFTGTCPKNWSFTEEQVNEETETTTTVSLEFRG